MEIEIGKKYLTRDGRVARIKEMKDAKHGVDGLSFPFYGEVSMPVDRRNVETWTANGSWNGRHENDLDLVANAQ